MSNSDVSVHNQDRHLLRQIPTHQHSSTSSSYLAPTCRQKSGPVLTSKLRAWANTRMPQKRCPTTPSFSRQGNCNAQLKEYLPYLQLLDVYWCSDSFELLYLTGTTTSWPLSCFPAL